MNDIEILEKLKDEQYTRETLNTLCMFYDEEFKPYVLTTEERDALENLIKENKELKEEIESWKFTKKYVEENYIARSNIIKILNEETINISGFECIAKEDIEELLED